MSLLLNQLRTGRRKEEILNGKRKLLLSGQSHSSQNDSNGDKICRAASRRKTDLDFALGGGRGASGGSNCET